MGIDRLAGPDTLVGQDRQDYQGCHPKDQPVAQFYSGQNRPTEVVQGRPSEKKRCHDHRGGGGEQRAFCCQPAKDDHDQQGKTGGQSGLKRGLVELRQGPKPPDDAECYGKEWPTTHDLAECPEQCRQREGPHSGGGDGSGAVGVALAFDADQNADAERFEKDEDVCCIQWYRSAPSIAVPLSCRVTVQRRVA